MTASSENGTTDTTAATRTKARTEPARAPHTLPQRTPAPAIRTQLGGTSQNQLSAPLASLLPKSTHFSAGSADGSAKSCESARIVPATETRAPGARAELPCIP
ncbi:hypothetical protein BLNAU_21534 [Blattamonas nauphoetae]|uniref:Uncharacterized protein n=1 Tax=Blattamonas nauphoetae TaxID=2049346 RepID=A0ABQ9WVL8_9EUKA|nr:hypothetical protein BLNAU_21534 [Blattamonas nauphoetae]